MGIFAHNVASEKSLGIKIALSRFTSTADTKLVNTMQTNFEPKACTIVPACIEKRTNAKTITRWTLVVCTRKSQFHQCKSLRLNYYAANASTFSELQNMPHWEKLRNAVLMTDLIVDKLVFKDVQLTATNDDQYFVFEDILYQVNVVKCSNHIK